MSNYFKRFSILLISIGILIVFAIGFYFYREHNQPLKVKYYLNGECVYSCKIEEDYIWKFSKNCFSLKISRQDAINLLFSLSENRVNVGDELYIELKGFGIISSGKSNFDYVQARSVFSVMLPPEFIIARLDESQFKYPYEFLFIKLPTTNSDDELFWESYCRFSQMIRRGNIEKLSTIYDLPENRWVNQLNFKEREDLKEILCRLPLPYNCTLFFDKMLNVHDNVEFDAFIEDKYYHLLYDKYN